ncbi:MAG: hypothetical protein IIA10_07110 [Proteobacteria bacterium]|nr:hypothetical protein [Pseudomonadota bacterium]
MNKVREADLGTPAPASGETVKINIDGLPSRSRPQSIVRNGSTPSTNGPKFKAKFSRPADQRTDCPVQGVSFVTRISRV